MYLFPRDILLAILPNAARHPHIAAFPMANGDPGLLVDRATFANEIERRTAGMRTTESDGIIHVQSVQLLMDAPGGGPEAALAPAPVTAPVVTPPAADPIETFGEWVPPPADTTTIEPVAVAPVTPVQDIPVAEPTQDTIAAGTAVIAPAAEPTVGPAVEPVPAVEEAPEATPTPMTPAVTTDPFDITIPGSEPVIEDSVSWHLMVNTASGLTMTWDVKDQAWQFGAGYDAGAETPDGPWVSEAVAALSEIAQGVEIDGETLRFVQVRVRATVLSQHRYAD